MVDENSFTTEFPESFLLIKYIDFGLSYQQTTRQIIKRNGFTLRYLQPIDMNHLMRPKTAMESKTSDVYAVGCVLMEMLYPSYERDYRVFTKSAIPQFKMTLGIGIDLEDALRMKALNLLGL